MRLVDIKTGHLSDPERYYLHGHSFLELRNTTRFVSILEKLLLDKPKDGFTWEQSMNSFTLRPNVYTYDEEFLNVLFDNNIHKKIPKYTGRDLVLAHIQVVKTTPGRSYQDWHRDTYQFEYNNIVGATPPAHKIIFYPVIDYPEARLKYIDGSHRAMVNSQKFDDMLITKYPHDVIQSSNDRCLLFETSLLHGVIPDIKPRGSIRVMYSFHEKHQFEKRYASKEHHNKLRKLYDDMVQSHV
jgi:hypothetical protein